VLFGNIPGAEIGIFRLIRTHGRRGSSPGSRVNGLSSRSRQVMQDNINRIHFMDSMRSVLMMLGVVIHSSNVFDPARDWSIYSQNSSMIAGYLGDLIHLFRIPAFFVVSGFFCVLTMKKYRVGKFIRVRLKRIVIPLLFTALTLNSIQAVFLTCTGFRRYDMAQFLLEGGWVSHLWFLNNLIVYFIIAAALAAYLKTPTRIAEKFLGDMFSSVPMIIVIFSMPFLTIMILMLNKIGFPLYSEVLGAFNTYSILIYLPYFAFGAILGCRNELLYRFSGINPIVAALVITGSVLVMKHTPISNETIRRITDVYLETLITWMAVSICYYAFYKWFNKPSGKWLFLSDASYTVYLFHHLLVIAIGFLLIRLELHPLFIMMILILIVTIITLYIHKYFVLGFKAARYLFNGK
jgi:glucan biosynthesis protein C